MDEPEEEWNTKLHAIIVDGLGNLVEFILSAGNDHNSVHAVGLLDTNIDFQLNCIPPSHESSAVSGAASCRLNSAIHASRSETSSRLCSAMDSCQCQ